MFEFFNSLEDPRRGQGQRHQLDNIFIIVIMAIISGHQGFRGFARFAEANAKELTEVLELKHGVPKFNTFRDVLTALDEQILVQQFIKWVKDYLPKVVDKYIALDGKAIKATTNGGNTKLQNFVALVNAFGHSSGVVYGMQSYENNKSGEGQALRDLVKALGMKDIIFTMDALHAQKKLST